MSPLFAFQRSRLLRGGTETAGAGIGLSTAISLSQAMEGDFWVELDNIKKTVCQVLEVPLLEQMLRQIPYIQSRGRFTNLRVGQQPNNLNAAIVMRPPQRIPSLALNRDFSQL